MDFKQLQSFVEVVRLKSFTQAARQLYTSQPTVSTHIRLLEEELQSRLILRTTKSIEVTPRGQELYEFALTVLEQKHNLIKRWTSNDHQMIQLGASTIPSAYILPEILPDYGNLPPPGVLRHSPERQPGSGPGGVGRQFRSGDVRHGPLPRVPDRHSLLPGPDGIDHPCFS